MEMDLERVEKRAINFSLKGAEGVALWSAQACLRHESGGKPPHSKELREKKAGILCVLRDSARDILSVLI